MTTMTKSKIRYIVCGLAAAMMVLSAMFAVPFAGGAVQNASASSGSRLFEVASGSAEFEDGYEIPDYLPTTVGGYKLGTRVTFTSAGSTVRYKQKVSISDEGYDDLLKIIMLPPEHFVNDASPKASMQRFIVKVAEDGNPGNYFEMLVDGTGANEFQVDGNVSTAAKAAGQTHFGGYGTVYYLRGDTYTNRAYGNIKKFSFTGRHGSVLDITYNNDTTTLKAIGGDSIGAYKDEVRIFNQAYPELPPEGTNRRESYITDTETWSGFGEGSDVIITITAIAFSNNAEQASMVILEAGGEPTVDDISVAAPSYGLVGKSYLVPEPVMLTNMGILDFEGGYEVFAPSDEQNPIKTGTSADYIKFDTVESGVYKIVYQTTDENYSATLEVIVLPADQSDAHPIQIFGYASDYGSFIPVPGISVPIGASASSGLDIIGNNVTLTATISKTGEEDVIIPVDSDTVYPFNDVGDYTVSYTATDYTGRTFESEDITLNIRRYYVGFTGFNEPHNIVSLSDDRFFSPSAADITIYDYEYGKISDATITVKVKGEQDNDFVDFDDSYSFTNGAYTIKYEFSYSNGENPAIEGEVERTLAVIDGEVPLISVQGMPDVLKTDLRKESSDVVKYLIGETGAVIAPLTVSISNAPELESELGWFYLDTGGTLNDITDKINDDTYTIILDTVGTHTFMFRVTNQEGLIGSMIYVIEVRDGWHTIKLGEGGDTGLTSSKITLKSFEVTDFEDATVADVRLAVRVSLQGEEVFTGFTDSEIILAKPGTYYIQYIADEGIVADSVGYLIMVADDTKPVITVTDPQITGNVGKQIIIAVPEITDNDAVKNYTVAVTLDGQEINVYDGKFLAEAEGTYTVTYRAEDISGNVSEFSYTVEITIAKKLGALGITLIAAGSAAVVGGGVTAAIVITKRKKKK